MSDEERVRCIYCGEELETEQEKSVHISEEHSDREENSPRKERGSGKKKNVLKDEWSSEKNNDGRGGGSE